MTIDPTRGATEDPNGWERSYARVWAVRAAVFLIPLIGSWLIVRALSDHLYRPAGNAGLVLWALQALILAAGSATLIERVSRRLLPLAFLFELTLDFPDSAPSRFRIAMRSGTIKKLTSSDHLEEMIQRSDTQSIAETALSLVAAMGRHDRLTRGHIERVRAYADMIAEQMELSASDRNGLAWGVLLHDVGKLAVPYEILNKKGKLADEEWTILKNHPAQGGQIIAPLKSFLGEWSLAATEHHERWDGKGYPLGLAGKEISLAGRITAVADAYDVITATRSYKKPMSHAAARQELVRCSGDQFDPEVVRAMLSASVGKRIRVGPFAWLTELPGVLKVGQAVTSVPGAVAASSLAATAVVAPVSPSAPPAELAYIDTTERPTTTTILNEVEGTITVVLEEVVEEPVPETTSTTAQPAPAATSAPTTERAVSTTTSLVTTTRQPTTTASTTTTSAPTTTTTTTAPTTTTTTAPTTTVPPLTPTPMYLYLGSPGTGDTTAMADLPLNAGYDNNIFLPDYDTDRNSDVGLTIKKSSDGLDTTDTRRRQDWVYIFDSTTLVEGDMNMTIWVVAKDGEDKDIGIEARLQLCSPNCVDLGTADWSENKVDWWTIADLNLGQTSFVAQPGDILRLRIVVPNDISESDAWFGYDTALSPADLTIH